MKVKCEQIVVRTVPGSSLFEVDDNFFELKILLLIIIDHLKQL